MDKSMNVKDKAIASMYATAAEVQTSSVKAKSRLVKAYYGVVASVMGAFAATAPAAAGDIFDTASTALNDVYAKLVGITTIIAVVCLTIAFLLRMFSRDQRVVGEANTWIKRIIVSWLVIGCLGAIVTFGSTLVSGNGWGGVDLAAQSSGEDN